jgi:DNA-binding MarR family transcriptional regulator
MESLLDLDGQIVAAIRRIMRAVDLHSRHLVDEFGLTGPQLALLKAVQRLAPATPGGLARELSLSPATVTGILSRLEARGLVLRRLGDVDRRTIRVELTRAGAVLVGDAPSLLQERFRRELAQIQDWEQHQILSVLQRIAAMMGAEGLDASPHLVADGRSIAKQNAPRTAAPGSEGASGRIVEDATGER